MASRRFRRAGMLLIGLAVSTLALPRLAAGAVVEPQAGSPPPKNAVSKVNYHGWTGPGDFHSGHFAGTRTTGRGRSVTIAYPTGSLDYTDPFGGDAKTWEYASWTSPMHELRFGATELVSSWTADTPHGSWLQVEMRGRNNLGDLTKWYVMGRWAADDPEEGGDIHRTSVSRQGDDDGFIAIDTFLAAEGRSLRSYQLRVTLFRQPGSHVRPVLRSVGAVASDIPARESVPASPLGGAEGIELPEPRFSQDIHVGEYPEYDGGGEAWCSPTSTSMVVAYWGRGPSEQDMSWVDPSYADPQVDYAARNTYDYNYEGAGNWPFNIAYAGRFGLEGFVTQLRSLTELEQFIKAGIPVVTSQSFDASELPGAGYSTNGHLMTIIGFTEDGDVIANDPASPSNEAVRHVYPRANFENVWQTSTGGISYIIYPPGHRLPHHMPGLDRNW